MDNSGTTDEGGRWLNYAELAELRGITRKAAIRLTQRHQWRRQPGNDGATRVLVPPDALGDIARRQSPRDDGTPDDFQAKALGILESALIEANKRAEAALALADRADARADRAEARAEAAEHAAKQAQGEALEAAQAAEAVRRADDARKARGRWRRLRSAWRGE